MGREWAALAGGVISGVGASMVESGRAMREERMKELELDNRKRMLGIENEMATDRIELQDNLAGNRAVEADKRLAERQGTADKAQEARDQRQHENRLKEIEKLYGERRGLGNAKSEGGLSADEARMLKTVVGKHTTKTMEGESVDWAAVTEDLDVMGASEKLVGLARSSAGGEKATKMTWEQAQEAAGREASDKAGWLAPDSSDFKEDGGSREAFVNRRAMEMMGGGAGKAAAPGIPVPGSKPQQAPAPEAEPPSPTQAKFVGGELPPEAVDAIARIRASSLSVEEKGARIQEIYRRVRAAGAN